jgi:hypothetical protein
VRKLVTHLPVLILLVSVLFTGTISAQSPERSEEFVYGLNIFTGQQYLGSFIPPTEDTLYVLADITNIISPRHTLVYFWPVTNEYKADWDAMNEVVAGTLEILQGSRVLHTISQTKYVIQYPRSYDGGEVYLYTGAEAEARYQEFDQLRREFRDEVAAYYEASRNYRKEVTDAMIEGTLTEEPLPPPEEPAPFIFLSTNVHDGFPVELPVGTYTVRLRGTDGQIVPESKRKLVAFSSLREGVGYTVVPQDKWTTPEQSDDPSQVLYARSGTVLYLQPFNEKEYNELYFARLEVLQSTSGSPDRWTWVHLQPQDAAHMEVLYGDQEVGRVEKKPYLVKQLPGTALGYEVLEQEKAEDERSRTRTPDFEGYEVRVEPGQPSFTVRLVDADGNIIQGSEREIRLVDSQYASTLFLLPALPLVVGVSLLVWRRRRFAGLSKYSQVT